MRIVSQRSGGGVPCALGAAVGDGPGVPCGHPAVAVVEDGQGRRLWGCAVHAADALTASATAQVVVFEGGGAATPAVSPRTPPPA